MNTEQNQTMPPSDTSLGGSKNPPFPMSDGELPEGEILNVLKAMTVEEEDVIRQWGQQRCLFDLWKETKAADELKEKIDSTVRDWASRQNEKWASEQQETVNSPPPQSDTGSQQQEPTAQAQSGTERGPEPSAVSSYPPYQRRAVGPKHSPPRQLVVGPSDRSRN